MAGIAACLSSGCKLTRPSFDSGGGGNLSFIDQVLSCCTSCSCCSCRASAMLEALMRRMIKAALFPARNKALHLSMSASVCLPRLFPLCGKCRN